MSRLEALPADQKSVLQLLLRQGKGYDDLSGLLRLDADEVRSRAYDALDSGTAPNGGDLGYEQGNMYGHGLAAIALFASMTNIVSGFLITDRMLKMFREKHK